MNKDIATHICLFLDDFSKIKFLSICKELHQIKSLVYFTNRVDLEKIYFLSYFDSFTNVIVSNLFILDDYKPLKMIDMNISMKSSSLFFIKPKDLKLPKKIIQLKLKNTSNINIKCMTLLEKYFDQLESVEIVSDVQTDFLDYLPKFKKIKYCSITSSSYPCKQRQTTSTYKEILLPQTLISLKCEFLKNVHLKSDYLKELTVHELNNKAFKTFDTTLKNLKILYVDRLKGNFNNCYSKTITHLTIKMFLIDTTINKNWNLEYLKIGIGGGRNININGNVDTLKIESVYNKNIHFKYNKFKNIRKIIFDGEDVDFYDMDGTIITKNKQCKFPPDCMIEEMQFKKDFNGCIVNRIAPSVKKCILPNDYIYRRRLEKKNHNFKIVFT